jgi:GNAT superfamily N-acetyltransferase
MDQPLPSGYTLREAVDHTDFSSFARLAARYHAWLPVDLHFQDIEHELSSLPGSYAQPAGCILLTSHRSCCDAAPEDVACVAVRPLRKHEQAEGDRSHDSIADAAEQTITKPKDQHDEQQQQQQDDASNADTMPTSYACALKRLWVEEAHQHAGLGRVLLEAALQVVWLLTSALLLE